ncbi:MAG TPA: hypothetical protein EYO16_02370 [Candidatus Marinimicrobia bacterium]|nr:hypothetical protein [Candidatus Neomarinimicrobiota bacterium]
MDPDKNEFEKATTFLRRKVRELGLPVLQSTLQSSISFLSPETPENIKGKKVFLVSAIGDVAGFKQTIEKMGCKIVGGKDFPDHFNYSQSDWKNVEALSTDADYIITTEKDWVKIETFSFSKPVILVEVKVDIQPAEKLDELLECCL